MQYTLLKSDIELWALIPVYTTCCLIYEHLFAKQILNFNFKFGAPVSNIRQIKSILLSNLRGRPRSGDTDFFLYFFVKNLTKKFKSRSHVCIAFDFNEISPNYRSNFHLVGDELYAEVIGYFLEETKSDPIVEFVGQCIIMYSFTCATHSSPSQRLISRWMCSTRRWQKVLRYPRLRVSSTRTTCVCILQ